MKGWLKTIIFKTCVALAVPTLLGAAAHAQSRAPAQSILPETEIVQPNKFEASVYQKYVLNQSQRLDGASQQIEFWHRQDEMIEKWNYLDAEAYHASVSDERTEYLKKQLLRFFFKSATQDAEHALKQDLDDWKFSFAEDENAALNEQLLNKDTSEEFTVDQAMYYSLTRQEGSPEVSVNLQKKNGGKVIKEFKIENRFRPLRGLFTSTMEFRNSQMSLFLPVNGEFTLNFNNIKPVLGFRAFYNYSLKEKKYLTGISREIFNNTFLRYTYADRPSEINRTVSIDYSYRF